MCEIRVVIDRDGVEEVIMENVTKLVVKDTSVSIASLFTEAEEVPDTALDHIDFLAGKVFLTPRGKALP